MTLSRILNLLLLMVLGVVLAGTLWISVENSRRFLEAQLASHAQDTASFLGMAVSTAPNGSDAAVAISLIDPIFDRGYYQAITFSDKSGQPIVRREQSIAIQFVPAWFVNRVKLHPPQGKALVIEGWREIGTIQVKSHPGYAYAQLWRNFTGILILLALVGGVSAVMLAAVLHFILQPLRAVEGMALQISRREFPTLEIVAGSRELRRVVHAMNQMSAALKSNFAEQAALARTLKENAHTDFVTGIANSNAFQARLEFLIRTPQQFSGGALLLLHMGDFRKFNQVHGHTEGDRVLKAAAESLHALCEKTGRDFLVARLTGVQFGIVFSSWYLDGYEGFADQLIDQIELLHRQTGHAEPFTAHCGLALYHGHDSAGRLLAQADMGLRIARKRGKSGWHRADSPHGHISATTGADRLRTLMKKQLEKEDISVCVAQVVETAGNAHFHNEVWARIPDDKGNPLPAQMFVLLAEQMGCVCRLDRQVVISVLKKIDADPEASRVFAVNLSTISLEDSVFMDWFCRTIEENPNYARCLAVECREFDLLAGISTLKPAIQRLMDLGIKFGVDHFGTGARPFGYLIDLKPDYLKIDGSFLQDILTCRENRFFIRSSAGTVHSIGIKLVAMGSHDQEVADTLTELGVDAVQRRFQEPELGP
jgi:diguanylate cyclase (GGDEF)-like protein